MATTTDGDVSVTDLISRQPYVKRTLLPEPEPLPKRYTIISADDHLVESPQAFVGRVPAKFADIAPRIVEHNGAEAWLIDGEVEPVTSANALISWPREQRSPGPVRFADMRPGAYDVAARVADMDLDGVWASVNFPSINFGFAGQRFMRVRDAEAGLAFTRAYNDWILEEVVGAYPDRFIPCQLVWFNDVEIAAAEIRRNAERGFHAAIFTENPEKLGLPSIHTSYWDPFFAACEETDTVINMHVGSSSHVIKPSSDSPFDSFVNAIHVNPILASFEWVFSGVPVRFPNIKIALSEGGIDWVPMVISRLASQWEQHALEDWSSKDLSPKDVFVRNFWFSALFDLAAYDFLNEVCPDHVMLETDYPHADSTWPRTQDHFHRRLAHLPEETVEQITFRTAAALYRHPLPPGAEAAPAPRHDAR